MIKNVKNLGCLALILVMSFGLFFAKFLVPIVPIIIAALAYYNTKKIKSIIFTQQKNIRGLTEGKVRLEGKAINLEEDISTPYFNQKCIGYNYKIEVYIPTHDDVYADIRSQKTECKNFALSTSMGSIHVNADGLDLLNLPSTTKTVHSLSPKVNDIGHTEYVLKNNDDVVIVGTVVKDIRGRVEIAKVNNEPFFATTKSNVERLKISYKIFLQLVPWLCLLYLVVNYFLFFSPDKNMPKNDSFAYLSIFGLPALFVVFWLIGRDRKDWVSRAFQYLASVCIITSLLSSPLIILFYIIDLEFYRTFCIFISIGVISSVALIFNYKKLTQLNADYEKHKKFRV